MKTLSLLLALVMATALAGCGGGGGGGSGAPVLVVATDTTLAASPTTAAAVVNESFKFAAGVASFGTTATTTVVFTSTATTPAFSINSDGHTATGTTTFGSCIFTITQSTFPAGSPLSVGNTITVDPCNLTVATAGQAASSPAETTSVALVLGAAASSGTDVTVDINEGGQIILNGTTTGTVTLTPVTGS